MQTVILGSGVPFPDPERAGASTLVRTSAGDLLFDCGRAVLMRAAAVGANAAALPRCSSHTCTATTSPTSTMW